MFFTDPYLRSLFEKQFNCLFDPNVLKTGISELKASNSSRVIEKLESGNFELVINTNYRYLRSLTGKQKVDLYIILRILHLLYPENERLNFVYFDVTECMNKKGLKQNDRYFYLSSLNDKLFELYIYDIFMVRTSYRFFARRINQKLQNYEQKTLIQVLREFLSQDLKFYLLSKKKPAKVQRHKGYRDHGSLGSEFSKTRKDQSRDWTVRQEEEYKNRREDVYLPLLEGWLV